MLGFFGGVPAVQVIAVPFTAATSASASWTPVGGRFGINYSILQPATGSNVTLTNLTDGSATVNASPALTGTVMIAVWEEGGFAAPVIMSVSAVPAQQLTTVTLSGYNFTGATAADVNGTNAAFTVLSNNQINITIPGTATAGPIHVVTPNGTASTVATIGITPSGFFYDLTASTLPSGMTATRASKTGAIYAMQTPTVATAVTGDDVYDCATTNPTLCGHWAFGPYTNIAPSVNDLTNAGYTNYQGATVTANYAVAPDGTTTASRVLDTSATLAQTVYLIGANGTRDNAVASVWVRDDAASPATAQGGVGPYYGDQRIYGYVNGQYRPFQNQLGAGSSWRRVSGLETTSSGVLGAVGFVLIPTGWTPVSNAYGTVDVTATGGVNAWGVMMHDGFVDYPLVVGSTGADALTVSPSALGGLLDANGDLDVAVSFISEYFTGGASGDGDGWIWSMATPNKGTVGVQNTSGSVHNFWVNSVSQTGGVNAGPNPMTAVSSGVGVGEVTVRAAYRPSTGLSYQRISYNGCFENVAVSVNGTAVGATGTPTSFYLGSNLGANVYERRFTAVKAYKSAQTLTGTTSINAAEGVIIGDSTSAAYSTVLSTLGSWIYTVAESRTRPGINSCAITGQTTAQQLTAWQASPSRGDAGVKWVYIMVGTNDINQSMTEAQTVTGIQNIINDINTNNPTARIILAPMLPFGFTGTPLATWTAVNNDIVGTGGITITGSNLNRLPLWTALDDGTGKLKAQYQYSDGQHENDLARQYVGFTTVRAKLQALGLL